jgi:hypothetical protein
MAEIRTDRRLLEKFKAAAGKPMTAEEIHKQRLSFVMGMLEPNSTLTRQEVERMLLEKEGKQPAAA